MATKRQAKPKDSLTVDALKRRYQVFVSSTFEDLQEERQQVIQALLETKCIPIGMELFPAASVQQWELIKSVIEESDYYIVIVAGRYGSLNEDDVGFTEAEFDYAVKIGKPVICFYHKNPNSIATIKCERTDAGRIRLEAFLKKVKKRLSKGWASSVELGSAVKSAIIFQLETNPQRGWIRADTVHFQQEKEKLEAKILLLEGELRRRRDGKVSSESDRVSFTSV